MAFGGGFWEGSEGFSAMNKNTSAVFWCFGYKKLVFLDCGCCGCCSAMKLFLQWQYATLIEKGYSSSFKDTKNFFFVYVISRALTRSVVLLVVNKYESRIELHTDKSHPC